MSVQFEHQALWEAVIGQALRDACNMGVPSKDSLEVDRARDWFTIPNANFEEVCGLANKCPIRTRKHAIRLIAEHQVKPKNALTKRTFTYAGRTLTLSQWAESKGLARSILYNRMVTGWSFEQALNTPHRTLSKRQALTTPGVGQDLPETSRDRWGSIAHDLPEIEFSKKDISP